MVITESTTTQKPCSSQQSPGRDSLVFRHSFLLHKIDHSGFGSCWFSEVDRPIMGSQSTKKDWITGLCDYVNLMRERCPDETHPPEDWLAQGLSLRSH